jgi:hypothetical protein
MYCLLLGICALDALLLFEEAGTGKRNYFTCRAPH